MDRGVRARLALALLLLVWAGLAARTAFLKSAAIDEVVHYPAGLTYWHFGDFRMNPEHPLLLKYLIAAPVRFLDPPEMNVHSPGRRYLAPWFFGNQGEYGYYMSFMKHGPQESLRRLRLSRLVPVLFGALGGVLAYLWGCELGKRRAAGFCAAALLLFHPEYAGHAIYATFDVPQLAAIAGCCWLLWLWWRRPHWVTVTALVAATALAVHVKLPVGPVIVLAMLMLLAVALRVHVRHPRRLPLIVLILSSLAAMLATTWMLYQFRFSYVMPDGWVEFPNEHMPPITGSGLTLRQRAVNLAWEWRLMPEAWLATVHHLDSFEGRTSFFLGEHRTHGSLWYFPLAMVAKTPLAMLAGLAAAALWQVRRRATAATNLRREAWLVLAAPAACLFAAMVFSRVNLGHRHVLFIYFPLCVWLGVWCARWWRGGRTRWLAVGVIAGVLLSYALSFPNGATYFNAAFGGGPAHGARFLRDSNTDAGQDYVLLSRWMQREGITAINLAGIGIVRPDVYGVRGYRWINADDKQVFEEHADAPDPALPTVVSVNHLSSVRAQHPGLIDRPPDAEINAMLVWLPVR